MGCRRCAGCGAGFKTNPRVADQRYCGLPACRRARRRLWQRQKLKADADYRVNQAEAQRGWAADHADYWRRYRAGHPDYVDRNRAEQRRRDAFRRSRALAKMDSTSGDLPVRSGTYRILPAGGAGLAKMDPITVKITVLSDDYADLPGAGPILQRVDSIGPPRPP